MSRARALLAEAADVSGPLGSQLCELQWGRGLLARWNGDAGAAVQRLERALVLSREAEDQWRQHKCLGWLAMLEFERRNYQHAREHASELRDVAARLGEDAPLADALDALSAFVEDPLAASDGVDAALSRLRYIDDKSHLAYALNAAATSCLGRDAPRAATYAEEALGAARAMRRQGEAAIAEALLACARGEAGARVNELREQARDADRFSARTLQLIEHAGASRALGPR